MKEKSKPSTILQVLPALNSGGVERGTLDFARFLVGQGFESLVMSNGGRLVQQLESEGSQHIKFPIHKKSLLSFFKVPALRRKLLELRPDIIHVRSRMPAWLIWQALKKWPLARKPALVTTFHGLYSVNFYSAIMGCGDQVIAISECVRDYILENYPKISATKIQVIHRGVDPNQFNTRVAINDAWRREFEQQFPDALGKKIVLMPGRLSPWKGQEDFIAMIAGLVAKGESVYGLIVGEITPGKENYLLMLQSKVSQHGLSRHIGFAGHREDMAYLYKIADVVLNLSQHAEPFGRTVIEALAVGTPVIAYNNGGTAESLRDCLPQGLVRQGDSIGLMERVTEFLQEPPAVELPNQFTLSYQAQSTLQVYQQAYKTVEQL